jgi:hypothetical protein
VHGFKPSLLRIDKPGDVQRFSKHVRDTCRTFEGTGAVGKLQQRREFMFYSVGTKTFMEVGSRASPSSHAQSSCATTV